MIPYTGWQCIQRRSNMLMDVDGSLHHVSLENCCKTNCWWLFEGVLTSLGKCNQAYGKAENGNGNETILEERLSWNETKLQRLLKHKKTEKFNVLISSDYCYLSIICQYECSPPILETCCFTGSFIVQNYTTCSSLFLKLIKICACGHWPLLTQGLGATLVKKWAGISTFSFSSILKR